ncbi:hypothetical protein COO60DRAFT_965003 [Scenedesmus sp. NREL 46B-D3]|nr:hypothetical protein COO60DRAFT_965003 [Scenedesmus sp. NREL 46B-D3]
MASVGHAGGVGTLVLAQQQASTSGAIAPAVSITDSVTLRLVPRRKKKSVKWAEDVEDYDENAGKRKSKKCCIFHRRRQFGDWSDDDDSDAECDCADGQQPDKQPQPQQQPQQQLQH